MVDCPSCKMKLREVQIWFGKFYGSTNRGTKWLEDTLYICDTKDCGYRVSDNDWSSYLVSKYYDYGF